MYRLITSNKHNRIKKIVHVHLQQSQYNTHSPVNIERCDYFRKGQVLGNRTWHAHLIDTQIRVRSDDGTCRKIHSFSHEVATDTPLLALQPLFN